MSQTLILPMLKSMMKLLSDYQTNYITITEDKLKV